MTNDKCGVCGGEADPDLTIFYAMVEGYTKKVPACKQCRHDYGTHYYELD